MAAGHHCSAVMLGGLLLPITKLRVSRYTRSCPVVGIALGIIGRDLRLPQCFPLLLHCFEGCGERALVVVSLSA